MGRRYILLYLGQVAGIIPTFGLQAIKAIVASQILDWPTLVLRPRFILFELSNTS
jgi:hypothetical protein